MDAMRRWGMAGQAGAESIPRRWLVRGVAIAATVGPGLGLMRNWAASARESSPAADVALLNDLLALEHLLAALYHEGLGIYGDVAFRRAGRARTLRPALEAIRAAETAHVAAVGDAVARLGGTPVAATGYAWNLGDVDGFLRTAATIEDTAVAAYAGAIPATGDGDAVAILLGLHSVEARHAAFLAERAGADPFPDAVDRPLAPADIPTIVARFSLGSVPATPEGPPIATPANDLTVPGLDAILADAAGTAGVEASRVAVVRVEPRQWPSSALGCERPGEVYLTVIVPGFLVLVAAGGQRLEYHTSLDGRFVRCGGG